MLFPQASYQHHHVRMLTINNTTYLVKYDPSAFALRVSSSGGTKGSASAETTYPVASVALSR